MGPSGKFLADVVGGVSSEGTKVVPLEPWLILARRLFIKEQGWLLTTLSLPVSACSHFPLHSLLI